MLTIEHKFLLMLRDTSCSTLTLYRLSGVRFLTTKLQPLMCRNAL